jgi:hypothetical protein
MQTAEEIAETARQVAVEREPGRGDVHDLRRLDGCANGSAVFVKLLGFS